MSHVIFTASMSPAAVDVRYTFMRPWYTGDGRLIREPGTSERGLDNSSVQSQCTASPQRFAYAACHGLVSVTEEKEGTCLRRPAEQAQTAK